MGPQPPPAVCLCARGYADSDDGKCAGCEVGYSGYPDCRLQGESGDEADSTVLCSLPTLPRVLEEGGATGHFYVDRTRTRHEVGVRLPPGGGGVLVRVRTQGGEGVWVRTALEEGRGGEKGRPVVQILNPQL